jgi:hypothetical protein
MVGNLNCLKPLVRQSATLECGAGTQAHLARNNLFLATRTRERRTSKGGKAASALRRAVEDFRLVSLFGNDRGLVGVVLWTAAAGVDLINRGV